MPVLQFKGKAAVERYHHTIPHHILEFDSKLSVLSKGQAPSLDGNLIIEGDNLLALKSLLPTHAGRIKCIYIDPPYNTGNEGWVYNDNLTQPQFKEWIGQTVGKEGEDATRHDKWCCMMYPRLALLRELLREDGAIFVSIDDNELHSLRFMMNEVFGEDSFIATIIRQKIYSPKSSARFFSESHDYILAFAKRRASWERTLLPRTEEANERYSNPDNDSRGPWKPSGLDARNPYSKGRYKITCPGGRVIPGPPPGSWWRYSEERFKALDVDRRIWWGENRNNVPAIKRFLSEVKQGLVPQTLWTYEEVGHTQDAKKEYIEILGGEDVFTTPKPVQLIQRIIAIATEEDDLVLDSFAGSGTTAQAVLGLNDKDKGGRRFVLIQLPHDSKQHAENGINICREITRERVRRLIEGYRPYSRDDGEKRRRRVPGLSGSFSYARLGGPLFGEYRDLGEELPSFDEMAKYIFYTETSRDFDPKKVDRKVGKIGEHGGTSYYLLYTPNGQEDRALNLEWLNSLPKSEKSKKLVVYCEKIWAHRDDLARYGSETGRSVRPMLVPFGLK